MASPLRVRVGGHDDLLDASGGHPLHQRFDVQVIGTHMAHGEITPWSTWYSPWYSRERSIAATSLGSATTQMVDWSRLGLAQMEQGAVSVCQVLTDRAAVDGRLGADDCLGKGVGLIIRHGQDIEGQPLG